MGSKKRKSDEFDRFLEKEIMTQERYDKFYNSHLSGQGLKKKKNQEEKPAAAMEEERRTEGHMRYEDAQIDERILRAVKELGYEEMTPIQEQAIPFFMTGRDIIGQAQERRRLSAFRSCRRSTRITAICRQ